VSWPQDIIKSNPVASKLHLSSVLPSHEDRPASQVASVQLPASALQSAAVSQSITLLKLCPSSPHNSSVAPSHRYSALGAQSAHFSAAMPASQSAREEHFDDPVAEPSSAHTSISPSLSHVTRPSNPMHARSTLTHEAAAASPVMHNSSAAHGA
jgi:hypothetical protein